MPAEFESGMFVRTPAWHRMGNVIDDYPESWEEARKLGGLEWEPISAPVFGFNGVREDGTVTHDPAEAVSGDYFQETDRQRTIRSDTGDTLGIQTDNYEIINHTEMGEIFDALLGQGLKYEALTVLQGGRKVSALAYLDEPITLPGDNTPTLPYLGLLNFHDGSGACKALPTSVRIVCYNTFSRAEAEGERNNNVFTFRHSKKWRDRIEEAKETIQGLRAEFNGYVELAEDLLGMKVTPEQREIFVREFIPLPPDGLVSDRVVNNVEKARTALRSIMRSRTVEAIDGTAFGLVQAAGEYLDHYRGTKGNRLDSIYTRQLLKPEPLKHKAISLAREVVKA